MKWNEKITDAWRGCYAVVIPSGISIAYLIVYILTQKDVFEFRYITDSENFTTMLESIIAFISIIISVFGFLLPILITSKNELSLTRYFIDSVDKKCFSLSLRMVIISGFLAVFMSCILFFFDIFSEWFKQTVIVIWIWLLFYFMFSSYRFISLLMRLFIEEKSGLEKKVKDSMNDEDEQSLKAKIRNSNLN